MIVNNKMQILYLSILIFILQISYFKERKIMQNSAE